MSDLEKAVGYLDAIRLASVAAANDIAFKRVVDEMLEHAPTGNPKAHLPTAVLIEAIENTKTKIVVT